MSKATAFLFLTRSCNLSCAHCYVSAAPGIGSHMPPERFTRILDLLQEHHINDIRLTGGEPMVHPQFGLYLTELNARGIRPRLITNGIRLLNHHDPRDVLDALSGCWISVYGLTQEQHQRIGGRAVKPLDEVLTFAGSHSLSASWIGVSVILTDVTFDGLRLFIESAYCLGVRKLRFLFSEPTGRAVHTGAVFNNQVGAESLREAIAQLSRGKNFASLTINNPFDLERTNSLSGYDSCLLHERKMWSFAPDGRVYSCCFNVDKDEHFVTHVDSQDASIVLSHVGPGAIFAPRCQGLSSGYWGNVSCTTTCPISAVEVIKDRQIS